MEKQSFYPYFFFPSARAPSWPDHPCYRKPASQWVLLVSPHQPITSTGNKSLCNPLFSRAATESWCDHGGKAWPLPQAAILGEHGQVWGQIHPCPLNLTSITAAVHYTPTCSPGCEALPRAAGREGGPLLPPPAAGAGEEARAPVGG